MPNTRSEMKLRRHRRKNHHGVSCGVYRLRSIAGNAVAFTDPAQWSDSCLTVHQRVESLYRLNPIRSLTAERIRCLPPRSANVLQHIYDILTF